MPAVDRFILLRHARAGKKLRDQAQDFERGLDRKGQQVALLLPEAITGCMRPELIISSPFRRCAETVEPLAQALGLPVVEDDDFRPDRSAKGVRAAFGGVPSGSVVCSHGEVIARLLGRGVKCGKGAFWIVERRDGTLVPVRYVEAPAARHSPSAKASVAKASVRAEVDWPEKKGGLVRPGFFHVRDTSAADDPISTTHLLIRTGRFIVVRWE
jgi:phosphohistidine phosphatase SixA